MALKDIFKMTKANRYTADGREELIKAQEAEVEDRRYKIGEISQKTGLQKTANGWVKPKKGNAAGANQEEKTVAKESKPAAENKTTIRQGTTNGDKWQKNTDYLGRERISMETPQGGKVSIYESDNPKQKNARFRVDTGSHYNEFNTMEEAKAFAEEHYGKKSESKPAAERNHGTEQKKRGPGAIHTPGKGNFGMDKMKEAAEKGLKGQELKEFMTGSKSEISEKTGLQKTANGWVKPNKGGAGKTESKPVVENKTTIRQGPNTKTLNETPAEHVQKNLDAYKGYQPYDMEELVLGPSGYKKQTSARVPGGGQSITYTKNGAEDITLFFDIDGELENADIAAESKPLKDSAPRVLTGDTRIRVRK